MAIPPDLHRYRLFGLTIQSAIPLPDLAPLAPGEGGDADVVIERGPVVLPEGGPPPLRGLYGPGDEAVLRITGIALYRISGGRRITVDVGPEARERNVRLYLLGSAMGVLLHQRRIVPLHANAIDLGGRAIAFMGASGAGKSTLAAAFHDRGWRVLSDDVCVVTPSDGGFLAQPGIPRLRLWRDAVERSGREVEGHERAFDDRDKYNIGIASDSGEPVPLAALYLLRSHEGPDFELRRLRGGEAIKALMSNTYRGAYIERVGDPRGHFATCLALAQALPLFELSRPWDAARIDEGVQLIEAQLPGAKSSTRS